MLHHCTAASAADTEGRELTNMADKALPVAFNDALSLPSGVLPLFSYKAPRIIVLWQAFSHPPPLPGVFP